MTIVTENATDRNPTLYGVKEIDPILAERVEASAQAAKFDPIARVERLEQRNRALIAAVRNRRKQFQRLETELTYYVTAAEDETRPVLRSILRRLFQAEYQADDRQTTINRLERQIGEKIVECDEARKDVFDFADLLWEMRTAILEASNLTDSETCHQRIVAFAAYLRGKGDADAC